MIFHSKIIHNQLIAVYTFAINLNFKSFYMKTNLFLAVFTITAFFFNSNAAVLTVSNNPQIPAQYIDAQTAYNAAANGDVLYLHGSASGYSFTMGYQTDGIPSVVTSKKVRVVGPGFNPTGQNNLTAKLNLTIAPSSESAMDNISIEGIEVISVNISYADINASGNYAVNNLQFTRCAFRGTVFYNYDAKTSALNPSINIVQSVIYYGNYLPNEGVSIFNSLVFAGYVENAFVKNCTMFSNFSNGYYLGFQQISSSVFENCIFKTKDPNFSPDGSPLSSTSTVYNRCLFDYDQSTGSGDNSYNSCLFATNPGFVDDSYTAGTLNAIPDFISNLDLRLAAGSAALTAGAGSTPIGVTGGDFPFTNPKTQGSTTLPQMNTLTISSTSVQQNGSINVSFQAAKQD
jgi:hypothetical protein